MLSEPRLRIPLLFVVVTLLHTTVFPQLRIFGVMPDLMLLLGVAGGLVGGPVRGAALGFAAGLVADLFLTTPFGLSALAYCLAGYAVGQVVQGLLESAWWFTLLAGALGSAGGVGLFALAGAMMGEPALLGGRLLVIMAVVGGTNTLLTPAMSRLVRWATSGARPPERVYA